MENDLANALKKLALVIKSTIDDRISNGTIKPEEELYFRWKIDQFQYSETGVSKSSAHGEYFTKHSWIRSIFAIENEIKDFKEYKESLTHMNNIINNVDTSTRYLVSYLSKLLYKILYDRKFSETDIDHFIEILLKDLNDEPVKCGADVKLNGIILIPNELEPSFEIKIRKTRIEDLEEEFPVHAMFPRYGLSNPSAIMHINLLSREANIIQKKVEEAITILRLFKVGSIKYESYRMHTESITDMVGGTLSPLQTTGPMENYFVSQEDVFKLKKFWHRLSDCIPEAFTGFGLAKTDYLAIAYKRYCDALFENGLIERRIANTVMGLEALFLKPGEIQELPFRLGIRISKLFSSLGYDPHKVRNTIDDAYKVRNLFAHGGQLSYERKKRLDSKYKDTKNLLLSALDYLRILIIIMIFNRKHKNEFLDLVDDSLIDKKMEEILHNDLSNIKEIIW